MNCAKCHKSIDTGASWQARIPEHGIVGLCSKCHDELSKLNALSNTILRRTIRDWYEGIGPQGDSIPEFDEQRHRILSLASGRMFELIEELTVTNHIEGVIRAKQKMWNLYGEIEETLSGPVRERDLPTVTDTQMTRGEALEKLEKLPADARTIHSASASFTSHTNAINLNSSLILLLGAILKQTIEGFPDDKPWYREEDPPCAHGSDTI